MGSVYTFSELVKCDGLGECVKAVRGRGTKTKQLKQSYVEYLYHKL
jgi:hypothetical protein